MLNEVIKSKELSLFELVDSMPLALPIPKESVIIENTTIICRKGKEEKNTRFKFWTPDKGYLFKTMFTRWLYDNDMTFQIWYDKFYLNIVTCSQRSKCQCISCNKEAKFKGVKGYMHYCGSKSCSELIKYQDENKSRLIRDSLSKSHKGNSRLIESLKLASLRPEVRLNRSNAAKKRDSTEAGKKRCSDRSRKFWDTPGNRELRGEMRRKKFLEDKEFRDKMFSKLPNNFKRIKSGYMYSGTKCSNSDNGYIEYDSSYEIAFVTEMELDDSVVSYIREPRNLDISYIMNNKVHWYWADFIVKYSDGRIVMIEIKCNDLKDTEENILKRKSAESYCENNGWEYRLITEDTVFNTIPKEYAYSIHEYYQSLKLGFKSTNDKIKDMILNNI